MFKYDIVCLLDGCNVSCEYLIYLGVVMMILLFDDGIVLMECQFCYLVGKVMIEFLVGKFDLEEGVFICGKCELCEEIGYMVECWDYFMCIYLVIFYFIEFIDIYFVCDFK